MKFFSLGFLSSLLLPLTALAQVQQHINLPTVPTNATAVANNPAAGDPPYLFMQKTEANFSSLFALINSDQYGSGVVTATLASTCNNCAPSGTGTFSSTTTLLRLTPASGGSTVSGFLSSGFINGQVVIVRNMSSTDNLIFLHLSSSSSSGNEISNQNAGTVLLPPLAAAPMIWDNTTWVFF